MVIIIYSAARTGLRLVEFPSPKIQNIHDPDKQMRFFKMSSDPAIIVVCFSHPRVAEQARPIRRNRNGDSDST